MISTSRCSSGRSVDGVVRRLGGNESIFDMAGDRFSIAGGSDEGSGVLSAPGDGRSRSEFGEGIGSVAGDAMSLLGTDTAGTLASAGAVLTALSSFGPMLLLK